MEVTEMIPNPNYYNATAVKYFSKALKLARASGQKNLLVACYQGLTDAHIDRGEYDKASFYLEENKKILATYKEENMNHLNAYVNYGVVSWAKKKYKMAENYYQRARDLALKFGDTYYVHSIDQKFYILYNTMGEYKKALKYYQTHINETLRQNKIELQDKVNHLEIKYETAKKEQANAALRLQTEHQQAQLEKKQMTIYVVAAMALAIFIFMILLVRQNRL
jgi:tetratricopeptide (TPR) repeat protein